MKLKKKIMSGMAISLSAMMLVTSAFGSFGRYGSAYAGEPSLSEKNIIQRVNNKDGGLLYYDEKGDKIEKPSEDKSKVDTVLSKTGKLVGDNEVEITLDIKKRGVLEKTNRPADIILMVDISGSMIPNKEVLKEKLGLFCDNIKSSMKGEDVRIAIIKFGSSAHIMYEEDSNCADENKLEMNIKESKKKVQVFFNPSNDSEINKLKSKINGIEFGGGTFTQAGFFAANQLIYNDNKQSKGKNKERDRYIVFLTDGVPAYGYQIENKENMEIETINPKDLLANGTVYEKKDLTTKEINAKTICYNKEPNNSDIRLYKPKEIKNEKDIYSLNNEEQKKYFNKVYKHFVGVPDGLYDSYGKSSNRIICDGQLLGKLLTKKTNGDELRNELTEKANGDELSNELTENEKDNKFVYYPYGVEYEVKELKKDYGNVAVYPIAYNMIDTTFKFYTRGYPKSYLNNFQSYLYVLLSDRFLASISNPDPDKKFYYTVTSKDEIKKKLGLEMSEDDNKTVEKGLEEFYGLKEKDVLPKGELVEEPVNNTSEDIKKKLSVFDLVLGNIKEGRKIKYSSVDPIAEGFNFVDESFDVINEKNKTSEQETPKDEVSIDKGTINWKIENWKKIEEGEYKGFFESTLKYRIKLDENTIKNIKPNEDGSYDTNGKTSFKIDNQSFDFPIPTITLKEPEKKEPEKKEPEKISGDDRIDTSVKTSKKYYKKADVVIVARHDLFPDSMTATVLSKQLNAPILLTHTDYLDKNVYEEIKRLKAVDIIIVGGVDSVSKKVENELSHLDKDTVERLSGPDRYYTSVEVAKRVVGLTGKLHKSVIASGEVFPDALAASSFAARDGYPILLVKKNSIPKKVKESFKNLEIKDTFVCGGYDTISEKVEKQLPHVMKRMAGKDRYATAIDISKSQFKNPKKAFLVSGEVFADALVIGPVSGKYDAPIILLNRKSVPAEVKNYVKANKINDYVIVGGTKYLPEKITNEIVK